ncbi:MAG: c-type cytochrome [Spirochaetota bacterium]
MTTRTAQWIFAVGTLSSAIVLGVLTIDTNRQMATLTNADKLTDEVVAGKVVFQKYNCNDCHTILGFGGYYAPDLTRVYRTKGEAYIRKAVTEPEKVFATSFRHMPNQRVKPDEVDKLVAFFGWVNNINNHDWPPQDSKQKGLTGTSRLLASSGISMSEGAALFKENNCFSCHSLGGTGGSSALALDNVGSKLSAEQIAKQIADPRSVNQAAIMPAFMNFLSAPQINSIADFLSKQKGGK